MIFAQALGENDEYKRLQKISQGIKEVSLQLRQMQTITDHTILKSMICSYPFQQASIELLISAFFDYFRNKFFLSAFYQALVEVAQLQEYREFLGQRSMRNMRVTVNDNVNKIIEQQQKQGAVPFSKDVVEKLLLAKRFACSFLKRFFSLAIELHYDLEEMSSVFRLFIIHTRSQKFQYQLIEQFQDCKFSIFYDFPWKNKFDSELDDFCSQWRIEVTPKWIVERKNSLTSQNYISSDKNIKQDDDEYITPASKVESVAESLEIVQRILCKPIDTITQHDLQQMHNVENIEILIKFIIHPTEIELIDDWVFKQMSIRVQCTQNKNIKNKNVLSLCCEVLQNTSIFDLKTESFNVLSQNIGTCSINMQILHSIAVKQIYESLKDNKIQLNLNHLAILIDQLLSICPRLSIASIIQYNFVFGLLDYTNNSFISALIIDIVDINIDKYQVGQTVLEQIWRYLQESEWIEYFWRKTFTHEKPDLNKTTLEYKTQAIIDIISSIGKCKDKQKNQEIIKINSLDEFIGPLGGQHSQMNNLEDQANYPETITYHQILEQDSDNIRGFLDERRKPRIAIINGRQHSRNIDLSITGNRSQTNQHYRNQSSQLPALPYINTPKSTTQRLSDSQYMSSETKSKRDSIDKYSQSSKLPSVTNNKAILTSRQSIASDNGFSSSKLIAIYPSSNTKASLSQFELEKQNYLFNKHNFSENIDLLEKLINCIIIYQKRKQHQGDNLHQIILMKNLIYSLLQVYLYEINESRAASFQCGNIFNAILQLGAQYGKIEQIEVLRDIVLHMMEYLNKLIINSVKPQSEQKELGSLEYILFQTLHKSFSLFDAYEASKQNKNIYRFYNESVIHLYILQFFKSKQNNIYQFQFTQFLNLVFEKAPPYFIQNILFNVGLISSLYNAYNLFFANGFKSHSLNENVFHYLMIIVKSIYSNLQKRNMNMIICSLEPLNSWKCLMKTIPNYEHSNNKKLKTDETEFPKSLVNLDQSSKSLSMNEHKQSILLALNNKKLSLKQSYPQKLSARLSPIQQRQLSRQPSSTSSQLVY